ncbi:MAG: hypothetical protein K8L99_09190, partial [Anaerolineae bacterium]|nr:hypothetical protein [Anaerolineae bacterium]
MNQEFADFDSLWDYDDPAATEARFQELLVGTDVPPTSAYWLELLTQIARAQGLQREFDKAHRTLDEIEVQLTAAEELTQVRVRYLLERGRVFNSAGQPDVALPLFKQAWEIARAADVDFYTVDAAHMLAIVEPDAKQQLDW